jgi:hypothetical protein
MFNVFFHNILKINQLHILLFFLFFNSCHFITSKETTLFELVPSSVSQIDFANNITPNDELNVLSYMYLYNGAGVGVGDFNNDGLIDVFFSGNQVSSRLYLNKGNFQFTDITEKAGLKTNRWATGVSIADVNADGLLDIYVCVANNKYWQKNHENLLFINQGSKNGIPSFSEMGKAYGLADSSYSTQAAFFDYDKDGDLDMYLLNNWIEKQNPNQLRPKITDGTAPNNDKLFRNEGVGKNGHPTFKDISKEAGIVYDGYGLGLVIADINKDGWQDIYVANDFITNDLMYINKGDGTFVNRIDEFLRHQSYNGMGTDIADYNNDGWADIIVLDMLPEDNKRQKMMLARPNYDRYEMMTGKSLNYQPEFVRNTLQLNQGNGVFSEIGQLAGVEKTDWSWAALFADYDNDGWKDLFITNGYRKDITDLDYISYSKYSTQFGTDEFKKNKKKEIVQLIPEVKIPNYIFQNQSDLTFKNKSKDWGINIPSYSNGAAYADLDNDGDLDLIVNNIDETASIFKNNADKLLKNNYLKIKLQGSEKNKLGIGSKVELWLGDKLQYQEQNPVRGFESSVELNLLFGLGKYSLVDSLKITWPDGKTQILKKMNANQTISLDYKNSTQITDLQIVTKNTSLFSLSENKINYRHQESPFIDFKEQFTLPHKYSQNGFGIAVGDINGDKLEDFYAGGAYGQSGSFFIQTQNGQFRTQKLDLDTLHEDMGVLLFDADNDQDLDLYVVSGGNEQKANTPYYQDRLYLNDGKAHFSLAKNALPNLTSSGSCVISADYDQDGDLDLFIGGRVIPHQYPLPPQSYLLRNDTQNEQVRFTSINPPQFNQLGMITAALWTDVDNDNWLDLLLVGEFMSPTLIKNEKGKLSKPHIMGNGNLIGWWNSLSSGDFDNDGDTDYVLGNLGLNTRYQVSAKEPLMVYAKDFDKNGMVDAFISHYMQGQNYLSHPRDNFLEQVPVMKKRFPSYIEYAKAPFEKVFTPQELEGTYRLKANYFSSIYLENQGKGQFSFKNLPMEAQFAPVFGMKVEDYDGDGNLDVLAVGNSSAPEINWGAYDAFVGAYLKGDGKGNFKTIACRESGFLVKGDAKGMAKILIGKNDNSLKNNAKSLFLIALNNQGIITYESPAVSNQIKIPIYHKETNAMITFKNGKKRKQEFYYGDTYLSQSSRSLNLSAEVSEIQIFDIENKSRKIILN